MATTKNVITKKTVVKKVSPKETLKKMQAKEVVSTKRKRGRPMGSKNNTFAHILLSDLTEVLQGSSVIPVKREFILELLGQAQNVESIESIAPASVKGAKVNTPSIPVKSHKFNLNEE